MKYIAGAYKIYSDKTMMRWTKERLIEEIHLLASNWEATQSTATWQFKLIQKLTENMPIGEFEKICDEARKEMK